MKALLEDLKRATGMLSDSSRPVHSLTSSDEFFQAIEVKALGAERSSARYRNRRPDDDVIRTRPRERAAIRRGFAYRRFHILLDRESPRSRLLPQDCLSFVLSQRPCSHDAFLCAGGSRAIPKPGGIRHVKIVGRVHERHSGCVSC
ncbi:MAG: hypothetical protein ACLQME_00900 [Alphaproteobacteria bacterium]